MSAVSRFFEDIIVLYHTPKVVRVRERRLGILQLVFTIGILVYILVKVIVIDQAYYLTEIPVGNVQSRIYRKPDAPSEYSAYNFCYGHYPDDSTAWWGKFEDERFPCRTLDDMALNPDNLNEAFISSLTFELEERYNCGLENYAPYPDSLPYHTPEAGCRVPYGPVDDDDEAGRIIRSFYTTSPDLSYLQLRHQFQAREFERRFGANAATRGYSSNYKGKLVDKNGKVMKEFPADQPDDLLDVTTLLAAAGTSLDDIGLTQGNVIRSRRALGAVISVSVYYSNRKGDMTYTYSARLLDTPGFSTYTYFYNGTTLEATRRALQRYGFLFLFTVEGDVVRFDFQQLLIQFVAAAALLSVAAKLTDFVMLNLLPNKDNYSNAKFDEVSFSNDGSTDSSSIRLVTLSRPTSTDEYMPPVPSPSPPASPVPTDETPTVVVDQRPGPIIKLRPNPPPLPPKNTH